MTSMESNQYGDVAPLVLAATGLLSATWALALGVFGRKKWFPNGEELGDLITRVSVGVAALVLAGVFFALTSLDVARELRPYLLPTGTACVIFLLTYVYFYGVLVHKRWIRQVDDPRAEKIIGGFPKTRVRPPSMPSTASIEEQIWGSGRDPDKVWPPEARAKARAVLTLSYLLLIVSGTACLVLGGAFVIAARAPRIEEFTIAPTELRPGETALMHWRVVNSNSVNLEPGGPLSDQGSQTVQPRVDTNAYTLTARNRFATRSVSQAVLVSAAPGKKPRQTGSRPSPSAGAVNLDARNCKLTNNVVVRGEGWLESEHAGLAEADCAVSLSRNGKYEVFIDYSTPETRPVRIALNGKIIAENGIAAPTGSFEDANRLDQSLGVFSAQAGTNVLQFHSEHPFPHIWRIRFQPI
jgi:hypothetical protein